ncbi:tetratricopeptide repeat protein, partial [Crocinitomix catalasitica]|nr:tetratricopeptide repeat protein [Crocinitomix catalasitica]
TKMGGTYAHLGKYNDAEKFLNKALAFYQKNGEASGQAEVSFNLGELYKKMGKTDDSEAAFHDCIDIGKRRNHPKNVLMGYDGLYALNKSIGKYQQALIYYEKYVALKSQIDSDELILKEGLEKYYLEDSNIGGANYQNNIYANRGSSENRMVWVVLIVAAILLSLLLYIFINIRKKNRILQSQKESIESKNDEIDVSLREKDLLLKEVHHRVKNNLQIISSLLNLQRHKVSDEATLEVLGESINRIQSISLIHQKFYQSSNLAKVDFKNYLTDLMESQKRLYGNPDKPVRTMVIGKAHFVGLDTAVPLGLIVAELITNCFKHAFSSQPNPELVIRIESGEYLMITVKDNGAGLPRGFSVKNSNSLGMEIVEALSEQLFGQVSYRNEDGAVFVVRVKEISQSA